LDRQASRVCITIIMITQQLDNASELSTGQETTPSPKIATDIISKD